MSRAFAVKKATTEQRRTLADLGLPPDRVHWVWAYDEAQKLIEERCALLGINPPDGPLLLTAWLRGKVLLLSGYSVHEMPQYLCYEVRGGTETYHVCLDPQSAEQGCSCPQGILKGDRRLCKHSRAVMVQLYEWAEASPEGVGPYEDLFREIGITALRAGCKQAEPQGSLMEVAA